MQLIPSTSSLECKFCHVPSLCIAGCSGKIFFVMHKFHSLSRVIIHLRVHNHLVANGKCGEFLEETRRLIVEEVDYTPNAKMFTISLSASKTFWARNLLDDYSNGKVGLLKVEQLEQIHDKFCKFSSPNVCNLVASFKHRLGGGYIDIIVELKSKSQYDSIQECCFLKQVLGQKVSIFKMSINGVGSGTILVT